MTATPIRTEGNRKTSLHEKRYAKLADQLLKYDGVRLPIGKKGFGSSALWINEKIFAFLSSKDEFVVKLPVARVISLVAKGSGKPFDPGHGRKMKQWLVIKNEELWLALAKEAMEYVKGSSKLGFHGSR